MAVLAVAETVQECREDAVSIPGDVSSLSWSPDGLLLAVSSMVRHFAGIHFVSKSHACGCQRPGPCVTHPIWYFTLQHHGYMANSCMSEGQRLQRYSNFG